MSFTGGSDDPAMCNRCGADRARPHKTQRIYPPCWNCVERNPNTGRVTAWLSPTGCADCFKQPIEDYACGRCGSYVFREAFVRNAERLPEWEFNRYPASWRLAYWAVRGAPSAGTVPYLRACLRNESNLRFVIRMRRQFGLSVADLVERALPFDQVPATEQFMREAGQEG